MILVQCSLNKLDAVTQPRAFGLLNRLVPLVLASNYYIVRILVYQKFALLLSLKYWGIKPV